MGTSYLGIYDAFVELTKEYIRLEEQYKKDITNRKSFISGLKERLCAEFDMERVEHAMELIEIHVVPRTQEEIASSRYSYRDSSVYATLYETNYFKNDYQLEKTDSIIDVFLRYLVQEYDKIKDKAFVVEKDSRCLSHMTLKLMETKDIDTLKHTYIMVKSCYANTLTDDDKSDIIYYLMNKYAFDKEYRKRKKN